VKVVFCIYDGKNIINGINAWIMKLLPELVKKEIEVSVICIAWAAENDCTVLPLLKKSGVDCTVMPYPHYTEKQVKWILQYLNTCKPEVFVPGNMLPALYASKWVIQAGIATVGILHNDDQEYAAIIHEFIEKKYCTYLTAVVAVSSTIYKKVSNVETSVNAYQIPYGSLLPDNKSTYTPGEIFKVVYMGRIVQEQKRIGDIVTAFCYCAQQLSNIELYIYGSGPDEYIVEQILKDHHSPANIFFVGNISNQDAQNVLLKSHCIVLMSDYEGIPVALIEAMACGVVPICKWIESGIPELLTNDKTGFFIEQPINLSAKIKQLQFNPVLWEEMSANCKQLIQNKFSSTINAEKWITLFKEVASDEQVNIKIPFNIKLPPSNPHLLGGDNRNPGFLHRALKKTRQIILKTTIDK